VVAPATYTQGRRERVGKADASLVSVCVCRCIERFITGLHQFLVERLVESTDLTAAKQGACPVIQLMHIRLSSNIGADVFLASHSEKSVVMGKA
jgi:hypothetical protein